MLASTPQKARRENAESLDNAVAGTFRALAKLDEQDGIARENGQCTCRARRDRRDQCSVHNDAYYFRKGLRMINAGWHGLTGSEIVGSPRAALLNLDLDYAWLRSHESVAFAPTACLDYLLGKPLGWAATSAGTLVPKVLDYIHRADTLEKHDPLYVCEQYERVALSSDEDCLLFRPQHPLCESHGLRRSKHERVATLKYKRMPDRRKFEQDTTEPKLLSEKLEYAQIALICGTAWRVLDDLVSPVAVGSSSSLQANASAGANSNVTDAKATDMWWNTFKTKLDNDQFTPRGRQFIDCAQQWHEKCIEDANDVLGAHGPIGESVSFDKHDVADEPDSVDWALLSGLCSDALDNASSSGIQQIERCVLPMKVIPSTCDLPRQSVLDKFCSEKFEPEEKNFKLVCPASKVPIYNAQPLPSSTSPQVDISTLVRDLSQIATEVVVDAPIDVKFDESKIRLPARPSLKAVATAFALNKQQYSAFACMASSFLKMLLASYPHDADLKTAATDAIAQFSSSSNYILLLGQGLCFCFVHFFSLPLSLSFSFIEAFRLHHLS